MNRRLRTRRGTVLIAVLVCMGVAITIVLAVVQVSLRQRRQLRQELQMEQTKWLMDAGIGHATARLKAEPGYDGETMSVAPQIEKYSKASIEISVSRNDRLAERVRVKITARLGDSDEQSQWTRRSKEIVVDLDPTNQK